MEEKLVSKVKELAETPREKELLEEKAREVSSAMLDRFGGLPTVKVFCIEVDHHDRVIKNSENKQISIEDLAIAMYQAHLGGFEKDVRAAEESSLMTVPYIRLQESYEKLCYEENIEI